jgi:amino acid permease
MRHEKPFVLIALALAILFAGLGVVYLVFTAPHLPSFVPGHVTRHVRHQNHYSKRAAVSFLLAGVLLFLAWSDSTFRRRRRRYRRDGSKDQQAEQST